MRIWVDDVRPAPEGYVWCRSVNETKQKLMFCDSMCRFFDTNFPNDRNPYNIEVIDIDHDAGEFACDGGDYIKLLDWLEITGRNYPIRIHSMNPVGVENMRRIIKRNEWREIR